MKYLKIPFLCGIVIGKYVITIRFKNGVSLGFDREKRRVFHFGKYSENQ